MTARLLGRSALAALVVALTIVTVAPAASAVTNCTTTQTGVTINDDVNVPAGADCSFNSSTVNGNITVQPGGYLNLFESTVTGSIAATDAALEVMASTVRGNIVSIRPTGGVGFALCGSSVGGSVTVRNATGSTSIIIGGTLCGTGSTIGGNLTVANNNVQAPSTITIADNRIKGVLYCAANNPLPAGGNNAAANKLGQCTSL